MTRLPTDRSSTGSFLALLSQRLYWSVKFHGWRGTVVGGLAEIAKPFRRATSFRKWCRRFKDQSFDRRLQVDTATCVSPDELEMSADRRAFAVEYAPTSPITFCQVIAGLGMDCRPFTFVDLGSGKGRVLMLAAEFPFREIIGVEIAPSLHQIAARNIEIFARKNLRPQSIRSCCSDVTEITPPTSPVLFFLYNPFHGEILETVIRNLQQSYAESPRPLVVVYHNPVNRRLFDQLPNVTQTKSHDQAWAIYHWGTSSVDANAAMPETERLKTERTNRL